MKTIETIENYILIKDFIEYFFKFYGQNGLYPIDNLNTDTILWAISKRIEEYPSIPFTGDSLDRELTRDVILEYNENKNDNEKV